LRLGFSTVMYENSSLTYQQILEKAALLGYQGIELNFKEWPSNLKVDSIKDSLCKHDVEVAAIGTRHMFVTHRLYLASPVLNVRKKAFDYLTECMKIANKLNCNIIQAGWAFQGSTLEASYNTTWSQAVKSLKYISKLCRQYGTVFVIEFACKQNAQLVNTMDDALLMLDEVGEENVLVMADTFHVHAENDSLREIVLKADKKLAYVHLTDNERLPPGKGNVNFREFVDALKKVHYNRYMVMEYEPDLEIDSSLKNALDFVRKLLQ